MNLSFTIPNDIAEELNEAAAIAKYQGIKAMTLDYLKETLTAYRMSKALPVARDQVEANAVKDLDTIL